MSEAPIRIVIVDDHTLVRKSMVTMLNGQGFDVVADYENGRDLIRDIRKLTLDVVLLDCYMPVMDGVATAEWIKVQTPDIRVLALSVNSDDLTIIRMLRAGAKGFIPKHAEPEELTLALQAVHFTGFYNSDLIEHPMQEAMKDNQHLASQHKQMGLTEREEEFMKLACSDMTYKEIADQMIVSLRTIDGYRESVFHKLNLKSRAGLVMYAMLHQHLRG